jgi:hypothetical protein
VLPGLQPGEYHFGGALLNKALVRYAHFGLFPLTGFANKFAAVKPKKPFELCSKGFSLVAGVGLSKRLKWLIINLRFASTFEVFDHFASK